MEQNNSITDLSKLKKGDVVAFEYEGNTAIVRMHDNEGLFMYGVGVWFDSNCIGEKDNVWVCDYIQNLGLDFSNNLRYASKEEQLRYYRVVYDWLDRLREMNEDEIDKLKRKIRAINQICGHKSLMQP
ncbi:MAG: hypothetical protein PUJ36_01525 [bacterium]|nr:hypothetical protein [bacterium]